MIAVEVERNRPMFDCKTCGLKHCDEDRKMPGSIGPAGYDLYDINGVIRTRTCLLPMVRRESIDLIRMYVHYKKGILPYSGGILDQPNAYAEAMEIIESLVNEQQ